MPPQWLSPVSQLGGFRRRQEYLHTKSCAGRGRTNATYTAIRYESLQQAPIAEDALVAVLLVRGMLELAL